MKWMVRPLAALAIAIVAGCSQTEVISYQQNGNLRIDPTTIAGADYLVQIKNVVDIGYGFNPNDRKQRNAMALRSLKTQCSSGRVVKEDTLELGGPGGIIPVGGPLRTYMIYVKCK